MREEAKQTRNFTSFNSVNFPEHKANYTAGCKKLFAHVMVSGITHKSWYLHRAEGFAFSQQLARK